MNDLEKIKTMVEDGFSITKISYILKIKIDIIKNIIEKNNFYLVHEKFYEDKIKDILSLYKNGVSAKALGIKFNIDKRRIQKWVNEAGMLRELNISHRLKFINENIFDIIDDENKAYWLGFLYADGNNCSLKKSIRLTIKASDADHIMKYVRFFEGNTEDIKFNEVSLNGKIFKTASYVINSKYLSKKLEELGCYNKSLTLKFPDFLREDLIYHFIRGYFDGDGCLTLKAKYKEWHWSIVSTKEFCQSVSDIFAKENIKTSLYYISKTNSNTYSLNSAGNLKIRKICDLLYNNSKVYLDRKYKKYLDLVAQNEKSHPGINKELFEKKVIL